MLSAQFEQYSREKDSLLRPLPPILCILTVEAGQLSLLDAAFLLEVTLHTAWLFLLVAGEWRAPHGTEKRPHEGSVQAH